jgi:HNH endonuclease
MISYQRLYLKRQLAAKEELRERRANGQGAITFAGYRMLEINGAKKYEHRQIMESHLGRPLTSEETVHHINHNPLDNRIENLRVMTRAEHTRLHNTHQHRNPQGHFTKTSQPI